MHRLYLLVISLFTVSFCFAQANQVEWTFDTKKIGDKKYEVHLVAAISKPWHIYSTTQADGGPLPTKVSFTKNPLTAYDGKIKEVGKMEKHFEEVFSIDTKYFTDKVDFVQVVNVKGNAKTNVTGTIEYMVCTDKECLPPKTVPFSVALK